MKDLLENDNYLELTVGKIVARDYRKALVFRSNGIDFCCGGNISVEKACKEVGADLSIVLEQLRILDQGESNLPDFNALPLDQLIAFIVNKHHKYTVDTLRELEPLIAKVAMVHGGWRPELHEIKDIFGQLKDELMSHMQKEEMVLFPAIISLFRGGDSSFCGNSIQHPISRMEMEHDFAGECMKQIRNLSQGFELPKGACATYTVVYKVLKEFEADLHHHIHLENNILFPKVLSL
ncbi:MAG: iron-sulfur cluster repair di-iron protein [Deltaproteobacteria bacterium]|nr:MAG: iron-sulfur cluster repair di-iron protein [Deltaproteobacteria bacterium]